VNVKTLHGVYFAQLERCSTQTEGPALHYVRGTLLKKAEEVRGGDLSGVFHDITRATPVRATPSQGRAGRLCDVLEPGCSASWCPRRVRRCTSALCHALMHAVLLGVTGCLD
jgi:hypothetical protein